MFFWAVCLAGGALGGGALRRARALAAEAPNATASSSVDGEDEAIHWWREHSALFAAARAERGPLHRELFELQRHEEALIDPALLAAVRRLEGAAADGREVDEGGLMRLLLPTSVRGVRRLRLFTPLAARMLLEELQWQEESGVPQRRPNGMNRFGAILSCDGCGDLGLRASLGHLARRLLRPIAGLLHPELVGAHDVDHHYAFVVRYAPGEDVALSGHTDASLMTLNVNLGVSGFTGGAVAFRGVRGADGAPSAAPPAGAVDFSEMEVGEGIVHLGGHYHEARPLTGGVRVNLIVWLFGEHDYVRVAPREPAERLSPAQRWGRFRADAEPWRTEL